MTEHHQPRPRTAWVDQPVTFSAGGITIYATYRHLAAKSGPVPAALLIAGSGPTDRNGNSPEVAGPVNELRAVADWLSADGVATLRYDKLGSGRTGVGRYASEPATIGVRPFEQESAAALRFLSRQPGVDPGRLAVIGHSEGALFALLLATGATGPIPRLHALGLLEPLSLRYLDVISTQIRSELAAAVQAGQITAGQSAAIDREMAMAIASLRAAGRAPGGLPAGLGSVLNPATARFLRQADGYDPADLASRLSKRIPVLLSCSNADIQVRCGEVDHLAAGLQRAKANYDFVHLRGVDHVLKQDSSQAGAQYGAPLPFSPQLREALSTFVREYLW